MSAIKDCLQKFDEWKRVYATVLEVSVDKALHAKMTEFKSDLLTSKMMALDRQASLHLAVDPQPSNGVGQGDQLAKYLRKEAKGKMLALFNKLKNNY